MATYVHCLSTCTIKPHSVPLQSEKPYYLPLMDLQFLSLDYIQTGLVFHKPESTDMKTLLSELKTSLSQTLTHFYPLSGHLVTKVSQVPPSYQVFLDCKDSPGADFVFAVSNASISDILRPVYVPLIVEKFFALHQPINHDGHTLPVLAVQVTELMDGIFIGCSVNHVLADGASFWNFFNFWSELCRSTAQNVQPILRFPVTKRRFINEQDQIVNLPYSHADEFIDRYIPPYRERIFHFTSQSISKLKAKANAELGVNISTISSFQALAAFVWRSVTRARRLSEYQKTHLAFPIDLRSRLEPQLPKEYFGNCISLPCITTMAGKLLSDNIGWTASLVHKAIADHTNVKIRSSLELQPPQVIPRFNSQHTVVFGMSPKFDVYTNDFGWGTPVAVRSGYGLKLDGKVTLYPGREGGGSMDLEICLNPKTMSALETDDEFRTAVSDLDRFE